MGYERKKCVHRCKRPTCADRLLKELNGLLLASVVIALLMEQPSKLLQNLRVVGITVQDPPVRLLRSFELQVR